MGSDFRWLMCSFNDEEFKQAQTLLSDIIKPVPLKESQLAALSLYKKSPEKILPKYISPLNLPEHMDEDLYRHGYIEGDNYLDFASCFWIDNIGDYALRLPLNEKTVLSWESYDIQPFSILAYSLGPANCQTLPGVYGNMMIPFKAFPETISATKKTLKKINKVSWERARRYISICSAGNVTYHYDKDIKILFKDLPRQMTKAYKQKKNFVAASFWLG